MPIAFDNASTANGGLVTTLQWTHTAGGANGFMVYANTQDDHGSTSAVAFNSVAMVRAASVVRSLVDMDMWTLAGPNTGALTASAQFTVNGFHAVGLVGYTGVKQSGAFGAASTATASATGVAFSVSSTVGSVCLAWAGTIANTVTSTNTFVTRIHVTAGAGGVCLRATEFTAVASTTSFSWSTVGTGQSFCMAGLALTATAAAAGGTFVYAKALLGVGH